MLAPDIALDGIPVARNPGPRLRRGLVDRLMFVVGLLLHRALLFGGANYHPLHAETLGLLIGPRHVRKILRALVRNGILKSDNHYIVGEKARGYRLTPRVLQRPLVEVVLNRELSLAVRRYSGAQKAAPFPAAPAHRLIYQNLDHLTVAPSAWRLLVDNQSLHPAKRVQWFYSLRAIERGVVTFSASESTGRVFTVLTGTARALRPHLRLDGCAPAEVDVRACQPFLLSTLYPSASTERIRYVAAVTQGDFYARFHAARLQVPGEDRPACSREGIKLAVQVEILFGGRKHRRRVWDLFSQMFPELAGLMDNFIETSPVTLATHLQRMEADIVIGRVVPRLREHLNGRPFLTIHDSIFCIAQDASAVAGVMTEEFAARVGAEPIVKISHFAQAEADATINELNTRLE